MRETYMEIRAGKSGNRWMRPAPLGRLQRLALGVLAGRSAGPGASFVAELR
jgi:hypothetical protein